MQRQRQQHTLFLPPFLTSHSYLLLLLCTQAMENDQKIQVTHCSSTHQAHIRHLLTHPLPVHYIQDLPDGMTVQAFRKMLQMRTDGVKEELSEAEERFDDSATIDT